MLRKIALTLAAAASLGAAALAPTSRPLPFTVAGIGGWHAGWHHGWGGPRFLVGGPAYYGGDGGCYNAGWLQRPGDRAGAW